MAPGALIDAKFAGMTNVSRRRALDQVCSGLQWAEVGTDWTQSLRRGAAPRVQIALNIMSAPDSSRLTWQHAAASLVAVASQPEMDTGW
jgi:hypothetical protein